MNTPMQAVLSDGPVRMRAASGKGASKNVLIGEYTARVEYVGIVRVRFGSVGLCNLCCGTRRG
jgi:hypothetical protein